MIRVPEQNIAVSYDLACKLLARAITLGFTAGP